MGTLYLDYSGLELRRDGRGDRPATRPGCAVD